MTRLSIIFLVVAMFAAPVKAGLLEDAYSASNRGDYATALRLLEPLAEQGNARAQHKLGVMHYVGEGLPQDYVLARKWLRMRAIALTQTPDQNIISEPETTGWIDEFEEGSTLLDIGANVGTFTVYAAVIKKARVYAFEPSGQNFFLLNRNILANSINDLVTAFPIALSNETKIDTLYLPNLAIGSSGNSAGEDTD